MTDNSKKIRIQVNPKTSLSIPPHLLAVSKGTLEDSCLFLHRLGFQLIPELNQVMIPDTTLAESLGYDRPRDIRKLISRVLARNSTQGEILEYIEDTPGRGRKRSGYLLNLTQALFFAAKSDTSKSDVIAMFMATVTQSFMTGELLPASFKTALELQEKLRIARERFEEERDARREALQFLNSGSRSKRKRSR